jgi:hypothetical protein
MAHSGTRIGKALFDFGNMKWSKPMKIELSGMTLYYNEIENV